MNYIFWEVGLSNTPDGTTNSIFMGRHFQNKTPCMLFNVQCWWYRWRYPLTVRLPPGATGAPPSPLSQQLDKNTFVICLPSMMSPITRLSASLQILKLCHFFWAISLDKMLQFFFSLAKQVWGPHRVVRRKEDTAEEEIVPQAGREFPPVWLSWHLATCPTLMGKPGVFCAQYSNLPHRKFYLLISFRAEHLVSQLFLSFES